MPVHRHGRVRHRFRRGGCRDRRGIRRAVGRGLRRRRRSERRPSHSANAILDETAPRFEDLTMPEGRSIRLPARHRWLLPSAQAIPAILPAGRRAGAPATGRSDRKRRSADKASTRTASAAPPDRRRLRRFPARPLYDRAQPRLAARRSRRRRGPDARRRDPVARARRRARRGAGGQMVPARRRAGRARGAVPVCAAAARRAIREEGPAGRLRADAGGRRGRQPARAVQFRAAAGRPRARRQQAWPRRFPTTSGRRTAGLADAQYAMAQIYANGVGGKKRDEAEARRWLVLGRAAEFRHRAARSRHLADRGPRRGARPARPASAG